MKKKFRFGKSERIDPSFSKAIRSLALQREMRGLDNKRKGMKEMTKKLAQAKSFDMLKRELLSEKADIRRLINEK